MSEVWIRLAVPSGVDPKVAFERCRQVVAEMVSSSEVCDGGRHSRVFTGYTMGVDRDLTQDECDWLGLDGRDGRGTYRLSDLTAGEYESLAAMPEMA